MPGPVPDPDSRRSQLRAARPTPGYRQLQPFTGEKPDWPWDNPKRSHLKLWKKLWTLPQANEWLRLQCEELVALYVRAFCYASDEDLNPRLLAEVRQLEAKIGLSPRAMKELGWEILEEFGERPAPAAKAPRAFVPPKSDAV